MKGATAGPMKRTEKPKDNSIEEALSLDEVWVYR